MKNFLNILCVLTIILCALSGCETKKEIKSVTINENTYYPLYIYSFKDAEITSEYEEAPLTPVEQPAEEGFVFTEQKGADYVNVYKYT